MNSWSKFATVFLCAAVCALSLTLIPRREQLPPRNADPMPVQLQEAQRSNWLLV